MVVAAWSAPGTTAGSRPLLLERLAAARIPVDAGAFGRPALADHRDDLPCAARVHKGQAFAAQAEEILFDYAGDEERGDAGIEGVSTAQEDLETGSRRQRVASRDRSAATDHRWPFGTAGANAEEDGYQQGADADRDRISPTDYSS